MFNSKSKKETEEAIDERNHVAHGTYLKGSLESQGGLRIDGVVEGQIEALGKLVLGEKGEVKGDIKCKDAEIEGTVTGNITSTGLLYLKQSAKVQGDITSNQLKTDYGAIFIGRSEMKGAKSTNTQASQNGQSAKSHQKAKTH
mgnify:CR=1 FL=1